MSREDARRRLAAYRDRLKADAAAKAASAKDPGVEEPDPLKPFETDFRSRPDSTLRMVDPFHADPAVKHVPDLIPDPRDLAVRLRTYRGRMGLNAMLYDPALCEGCKSTLAGALHAPIALSEYN
jgi:hypothetical protein